MIDKYNYNDEPSGRADTLAMALDKCERLEKQLKIAVRKLEIAKDLLEAGHPMIYLAIEHIDYALERIKAIDEIAKEKEAEK